MSTRSAASPEFIGGSYRELSYWHDTTGDSWVQRPPLGGSTEVDVAIVGAGYTGLWTAYYLTKRDPSLRIAVLEKHVAGFGASGRHGGFCSGGHFPVSVRRLAQVAGRDRAVAMYRAMFDTVDEIDRVIRAEGIDCDWAYGGSLTVARTPVQWLRARQHVEDMRRWGFGDEDLRLLDAEEMRARVGVTSVLGGTFNPHCAVMHPAKLVRGLARAVEARGVPIYEGTAVTRLENGTVTTEHGSVRAEVVVRAVEGYTPLLAGHRRLLAPVYSLMLVTEPLGDGFWAEAGLHQREALNDFRHLIIYGQRTVDGRLAFGGRGAPYHFGSRIRREYDTIADFFPKLRRSLAELFPAAAKARVTHTWGGVFAVPRDWHPAVGLDRRRRLAWAGGYLGQGVAASNLAARTLADLITGEQSDLTRLPWVNHEWPSWEPEPVRWLGINAALRLMSVADTSENRTGRSSVIARALGRLFGQ